MTLPIYKRVDVLHPVKRLETANAGLWYTRFFNGFSNDWSVGSDAKLDWITQSSGMCGHPDLLHSYSERCRQLAVALGGGYTDFSTDWHFVTGLGISHPVENGFAWQQTLGVPYLAGSGVKGLLRDWVENWMECSEEIRASTLENWFGTADEDANSAEEAGSAGHLLFFDALPIKPVRLIADVATPHMGKWYEKGDQISPGNMAETAPADWHSPVPVPFLVVHKATFRFMIAPRQVGDEVIDELSRQAARKAQCELSLALELIGAGAKTATGYGRMIREVDAAEKCQRDLAAHGLPVESGLNWSGAAAKWNKGSSILTIAYASADGKKICEVVGKKALQFVNNLSEHGRKRLNDGKKPLIVNCTVDIQGNQTTLTGLSEPTS